MFFEKFFKKFLFSIFCFAAEIKIRAKNLRFTLMLFPQKSHFKLLKSKRPCDIMKVGSFNEISGVSDMKEKISIILKVLALTSATLGTVLALVFAERDGYSHPATRLLYFTNLSNIWIALSIGSLLILPLILPLIKEEKNRSRLENTLHVLRYIFTVSIAITGIVYCALLAPFARGYNPWTLSGILSHVCSPVFAVADFLTDTYAVKLKRKELLYTAIPPLCYLIFASVLILLNVDFGRGDPYPYFFFNYYSPAGFFGFSDQPPFILGSFYWILLFVGMVLGCAAVLRNIKESINRKIELKVNNTKD